MRGEWVALLSWARPHLCPCLLLGVHCRGRGPALPPASPLSPLPWAVLVSALKPEEVVGGPRHHPAVSGRVGVHPDLTACPLLTYLHHGRLTVYRGPGGRVALDRPPWTGWPYL